MKLSNTPYTYIFSTINHVFQCFELDHEVISCAEAAHAKGFPLKNELKTLVLDTNMGLCTVNTMNLSRNMQSKNPLNKIYDD